MRQFSPADCAFAQKAFTWPEVRDKFEAANPSLRAGQIGVDESRAQETTAYLRPNPNLTIAAIRSIRSREGPARRLGILPAGCERNYLLERQHKRELRLESAQEATQSRCRARRTWNEPCFSICARRSSRRCREKRFSIWPRKISPTTITFWK